MKRYTRHLNLLGPEGQEKLLKAKVLLAGVGGLGSSVLQLLIRLGFGEIHIYDDGILDLPDLNRQIIYDMNDLGKPKVTLATEKMQRVNPEITIVPHKERLTNDTNSPKVNLVMDCLDNFNSRLVLEKLFWEKGIPIVHAGIVQYFGQATTLIPGETGNYTDLFGQDISALDDGMLKDVYPPAVMNLASIQVSEAVKLICSFGDLLANKILTVDLLTNSYDIITCRK